MSGLKRQLEAKTLNEIPNFTKDEIHLVSYNPDAPPTPVGSYSYRLQKYPADIDLMDNVNEYKVHGRWETATSRDQIIMSFTQRIKQIAKDIKRSKGHYLMDFKAGVDERYLFVLGQMQGGYLTFDSDFIDNVTSRYKAGMYSKEDVDAIIALAKIGPMNGQQAYDGITKILRKYYVLRWSLDELIAGRKSLPLKESITLQEALGHFQLVKMDLAVMMNGRLVEMSNIWSIFYFDHKLNAYEYLTPLPKVEHVPFDIEKLYWSDMYYSPYKVIKRIFSYSKNMFLRGDNSFEDYLRKTVKVVEGDLSQLYQIKSELATILDVHAIYGHVSPAAIDHQMDGMKARLANNLQLSDQTADMLAQMLESYIAAPLTSGSHAAKMNILEQVKQHLEEIINHSALNFLIVSDMNPPPLEMLPTVNSAEELNREGAPLNPFCPIQYQMTYNWHMIRHLDDKKIGGYVARSNVMAAGMMRQQLLPLDNMRANMGDPSLMAQLMRSDLLRKSYSMGGCATCGGSNEGTIARHPMCICCRGTACSPGCDLMDCGDEARVTGGVDWGKLGKSALSIIAPALIKTAPEIIEKIVKDCPVCEKPKPCKPCEKSKPCDYSDYELKSTVRKREKEREQEYEREYEKPPKKESAVKKETQPKKTLPKKLTKK